MQRNTTTRKQTTYLFFEFQKTLLFFLCVCERPASTYSPLLFLHLLLFCCKYLFGQDMNLFVLSIILFETLLTTKIGWWRYSQLNAFGTRQSTLHYVRTTRRSTTSTCRAGSIISRSAATILVFLGGGRNTSRRFRRSGRHDCVIE